MNVLTKARYGLMIYNNSDVWVGKSFETYGEYSESEVSLFRDVIKKSDLVLDVGANIGSHTIPFAHFSDFVIAFEAERNAFNVLCGNVAINNLRNVFCHQRALGRYSGTISVPELDIDKTTNFGGLSLEGDHSKVPHYDVPLMKIDDLNLIRLNFIKIDVEGMEQDVLLGGRDTIQKCKPIIYAENDRMEKQKDLYAILRDFGYEIYQHTAMFFNANNYFAEKENVFIDKTRGLHFVSSNVFCWHKTLPCPISIEKHGLQRIL